MAWKEKYQESDPTEYSFKMELFLRKKKVQHKFNEETNDGI